MASFLIAGLPVLMEPRFAPLLPQSKAYRTDEQWENAIDIRLTKEQFQQYRSMYPTVDDALLEYMFSGSVFYHALISYGGLMLHASAVELDGKAYLFSAPSGTGKSTHTGLWLKKFGDRAAILNDDKPAIRMEGDEVFVYGTPWSGKTDLNINRRVPLAGICFLERGTENRIARMAKEDALSCILDQTVRPSHREAMMHLLDGISLLLEKKPVYKMQCNMDPQAAEVSFRAMSEGV